MIETIVTLFDKFIDGAHRLGDFTAAAVWAFFSLVFAIYIFYDMRIKKQSSDAAWEARLKEAEADGLIASALEKLANEIKELRYRMDQKPGGS